jgi:hypothetical protein
VINDKSNEMTHNATKTETRCSLLISNVIPAADLNPEACGNDDDSGGGGGGGSNGGDRPVPRFNGAGR